MHSKAALICLTVLSQIAMWMFVCVESVAAVENVPAASLTIPPMVKEQSVSTYVPSAVAPGQGLAVNIIYPQKPRYPKGAPVVVVVPGGHMPSGLDFSMHAAQEGFIELRFAFPGGGKKNFASTGICDQRGIHSQEALRDILLFAGGKLNDYQGKSISDLVPLSVYNKTVGAVGWSNGGNVLLVALSKYASELPFIGWLAFYESPIGQMFYLPALGGAQDMIANRHYKYGTGAAGQVMVDCSKLHFLATGSKSPGAHKKLGEPEIPGLLFFDENGNKTWEESSEFALSYATEVGLDKQIYPLSFLRALRKLPDFKKPGDWPNQLATAAEAQAFFTERDGSLYIKDVSRNFPNMPVCIFASKLDHLQRQPDHPHIAMQYNAWLDARHGFVRLNPDPLYVAAASLLRTNHFVANKPNISLDADSMDSYLEPEGLVPDYVFMEAAIAELSDRVFKNKLGGALTLPLVNFSNGALKVPGNVSSDVSKDGTKPAKKPDQQ